MERIKIHEGTAELSGSGASSVKEEDQSYTDCTLGGGHLLNEAEEHKVLGIIWNHSSDLLSIDLNKVVENAKLLPPTKRSLLKVVAQVNDPLGWISPVIITMKILFQKLFMDKEDSNTPLKKEHRELFERQIDDLEQVGTISFSRCYFQGVAGEVKSVQLHGFSDASDASYAAIIYIRIETDVNIKTSLIASKTKVAPISGETTPRLELLGAYLLARLISSTYQALQEAIHIDRIFCWFDSTAILI